MRAGRDRRLPSSLAIADHNFPRMGKLVKMDVLIVGLRGLGVEVAKNLCLAGPRSVTLFVRARGSAALAGRPGLLQLAHSLQDPEPTTPIDVGANYYLTMAQLGVPRAAACVDRLAELNPYVSTTTLKEPAITEDVLRRFHVVVFTNTPRADLIRWGDFCHAQVRSLGGRGTRTRRDGDLDSPPPDARDRLHRRGRARRGGLGVRRLRPGARRPRPQRGEREAARGVSVCGQLRVTPPPHTHTTLCPSQTKSAVVMDITSGKPATVFTHDGKRHGFDDGDWVVFREVRGKRCARGMPASPRTRPGGYFSQVEGMRINDGVPRRIFNVNQKAFSFQASGV